MNISDFATYAGLAATDPRGQWTTADLAQWAYSDSDDVIDYRRVTPDDDAYSVERADGAKIIFALEYDDDDNVNGWTYTEYDTAGDPITTDGDDFNHISGLASAAEYIINWAAA